MFFSAPISAQDTTIAAATAPARGGKNVVEDRLKPNGPVTITATNVDWAKNGQMIYSGNVVMTSDTLNLNGDRLELEQLGGGHYRAKVNGAPAHLMHQGNSSSDQDDPPVTARGRELHYDSETGLADITGEAKVTRGDDEITGELIHYNVNERRIQAAGGNGGQVKIVIQPNKDGVAVPSPGSTPPPKP